MEESEDKIIVFESYDTVMDANLVKTKLDAYGIPCFLSDENFVGLYPIRNELFPGVRLHIFEKDKERVKEILGDQHTGEVETIHCPFCRSEKVAIKPLRKGLIPEFVNSLMEGLFLRQKEIYHCIECGGEFDPVPKDTKSSTP
jgi:DNA-directed RNA polymerase subunit RPC12/RpoP